MKAGRVSGRELILGRLRLACAAVPRVATPLLPEPIPAPSLGWNDFRQALEETDGELHATVGRGDLPAALARIAGGSWSCAHGAARLLGRTPAPADARALDGAPFLAASGRLAVARTGSVLVTEQEVPVRIHLLLPETVLLLVPHESLVDDLPALYASLDPAALARGYFTLVTGPSRTADIEQTLVTGAHGPRRLIVIPYT